MPNWVSCTLTVKGKISKVDEFIEENTAIKDGIDQPNTLSFVRVAPCRNTCMDQQKTWGTKWDAYDMSGITTKIDDVEKTVYYDFDTAWSPPTNWLHRASEKYPSLEFSLDYIEGNNFRGFLILKADDETWNENGWEMSENDSLYDVSDEEESEEDIDIHAELIASA